MIFRVFQADHIFNTYLFIYLIFKTLIFSKIKITLVEIYNTDMLSFAKQLYKTEWYLPSQSSETSNKDFVLSSCFTLAEFYKNPTVYCKFFNENATTV